MFKNIQDKLLISNPLLWNLKIVPFAFIALCFHIIFFAIGYISGEVDFSEKNYQNYDSGITTGIIVFFSIVVSILVFIIWLVLYSRNNAFKSFYPKNNFSLFKEFLYILLFCALNCTFTLSYFAAKDLRMRNYYTEKEVIKKLEILSLSSVFIDGAFEESGYVNIQKNGQMITEQRDHFFYKNRKYSLNSLMNKELQSQTSFNNHKDSILRARVKGWLYDNKKDSVKWVFDAFMKMAKQHNLKSNITAEKWFELVYDYPEFTKYTVIGPGKNYTNYANTTGIEEPAEAYTTTAVDSNTIAGESVKQFYSKYYVPFDSLSSAYRDIYRAQENPTIDLDSIYIFLYVSIAFSISIFSFKVTSGRNWLIALVSLGVTSIIIGIFSAMSGGTTFFILYLLVFFGLLAHFIITLTSKNGKGISGITLNQILWLFPGVLPTIYYFILEISRSSVSYYDQLNYVNGVETRESYTKIVWMEDHFPEMMLFNIAFSILFIFLFSIQIKKWKGIAED